MNIAVITRHAITNYGSILQSIATQRVLEQLGHTSRIIDYIPEDEHYLRAEKTALRSKPSWNANFLKRQVYLLLRQPVAILAGRQFEAQRKKYLQLTRRYTCMEALCAQKPEADVYMTGSDQVWGPVAGGSYDKAYCLGFTDEEDVRIAYAASFGRTQIPEQTVEYFKKQLHSYRQITVREHQGAQMLNAWGIPASQVLDPTLLLNRRQWESLMTPTKPKEYILVYQIHNDPKLNAYAQKVAKAQKLPLLRISASLHQINRGGRLVWLPKIGEFLSYIANASCLITDSFHGTAFALGLNVPFVNVIAHNGTESRIASLLQLVQAQERILEDPDDVALAQKGMDYDRINGILDAERQQSMAVLQEMLCKTKEMGARMKTVCAPNQCAGCMACVDVCPKGAIRMDAGIEHVQAHISPDLCADCGLCASVCPANHCPEQRKPFFWAQGWAEEKTVRTAGASGGVAGALARSFIGQGGVVYSCAYKQGAFGYCAAERIEDTAVFAGSKYVKSDPSGMHKAVKKRLQAGQKVLVIGLPCQIAGLINYVGPELRRQLYTADLICHGTPSPRVLDAFLRQHGKSLDGVQDVRFRRKGTFQVSLDGNSVITRGVVDSYMLAFLGGTTYTENCYTCPYARLERVTDLTLGDSWGSELLQQERNGVSLVLCQSEKGETLLEQTPLHLESVDLQKAMKNNRQLCAPSKKPEFRQKFLQRIQQGGSMDALVLRYFPKDSLKQRVKALLILTGLRKSR